MRKTMILAALLAVAAGMAGAEEKRSFGCGYGGDNDREEVRARATNPGLSGILHEYRIRWDAQHIRAQCEAYRDGGPYRIACLDGHRDWSAIESAVPSEFWGLTARELRPHLLNLQAEDDGFRDAIKFCRSVGALRSGR